MAQLLEFFPLFAFVSTLFYLKEIGDVNAMYTATSILMGATLIQMVGLKALNKKISNMHFFVMMSVFLFGGLTLTFKSDVFIKYKSTIVYVIMALVFFISHRFFKRNIVQMMLSSILNPPETIWAKLNVIWIIMFLSTALINAVLVKTVSDEIWALSKIGFGIANIIFMGLQLFYLRRYIVINTSNNSIDNPTTKPIQ